MGVVFKVFVWNTHPKSLKLKIKFRLKKGFVVGTTFCYHSVALIIILSKTARNYYFRYTSENILIPIIIIFWSKNVDAMVELNYFETINYNTNCNWKMPMITYADLLFSIRESSILNKIFQTIEEKKHIHKKFYTDWL